MNKKNLTSRQVQKIIREIETDLSSFTIAKKNLRKFKSTTSDVEFLSYVNGTGGYYVKFLALLVKKLQFKTIVELGNREGLSTLAIYDQLPASSRFVTIDIEKDQRYCPDQMFKDKRVSFIFGDVCDPSLIGNEVPLDIELLFSDTIHFNFQIEDEFAIYQHLLADTALVAIDDIHTNDKGFFWEKLSYKKWDLTELCHVSGWGLFLFKRKRRMTKQARMLEATTAAAKIWKRKHDESLQVIENMVADKATSKARALVKKYLVKYPKLYASAVKIGNKFIR